MKGLWKLLLEWLRLDPVQSGIIAVVSSGVVAIQECPLYCRVLNWDQSLGISLNWATIPPELAHRWKYRFAGDFSDASFLGLPIPAIIIASILMFLLFILLSILRPSWKWRLLILLLGFLLAVVGLPLAQASGNFNEDLLLRTPISRNSIEFAIAERNSLRGSILLRQSGVELVFDGPQTKLDSTIGPRIGLRDLADRAQNPGSACKGIRTSDFTGFAVALHQAKASLSDSECEWRQAFRMAFKSKVKDPKASFLDYMIPYLELNTAPTRWDFAQEIRELVRTITAGPKQEKVLREHLAGVWLDNIKPKDPVRDDLEELVDGPAWQPADWARLKRLAKDDAERETILLSAARRVDLRTVKDYAPLTRRRLLDKAILEMVASAESTQDHTICTIAETLVDEFNADVDFPDETDNTPVMLAARRGLPETMSFLLKNTRQVRWKNAEGATLLHLAASEPASLDRLQEKYSEVLTELINESNDQGRTPLMMALESDCSKCVSILAAARPDLYIPDEEPWPHLLKAASFETKTRLLEKAGYFHLFFTEKLQRRNRFRLWWQRFDQEGGDSKELDFDLRWSKVTAVACEPDVLQVFYLKEDDDDLWSTKINSEGDKKEGYPRPEKTIKIHKNTLPVPVCSSAQYPQLFFLDRDKKIAFAHPSRDGWVIKRVVDEHESLSPPAPLGTNAEDPLLFVTRKRIRVHDRKTRWLALVEGGGQPRLLIPTDYWPVQVVGNGDTEPILFQLVGNKLHWLPLEEAIGSKADSLGSVSRAIDGAVLNVVPTRWSGVKAVFAVENTNLPRRHLQVSFFDGRAFSPFGSLWKLRERAEGMFVVSTRPADPDKTRRARP